MQSNALKLSIDAWPVGRTTRSGQALLPAGLLIPLMIGVLALNPAGYIGGGSDDWHYLAAARCWVAEGICPPHDHWSARWPLIAPMAASIAQLGESRLALGLAPLVYAAAALLLFAHIVQQLFGRGAALLAGTVLLLTPAFSAMLLKPNVDGPELAWILAAVAAWLAAIRTRRRRWALLTGAAFALAVQTRETGLAYLAPAGIAFLCSSREQKRLMLWAVPAFAGLMALESCFYWLSAGDPFARVRLALSHTQIVSTELSGAVDTSRSPLFNPAFIAGWRPANGIDLHWTINPLINLLTHREIGVTLVCGLLLLAGTDLRARPDTRRKLVDLIAAAGLATLLLIYGLCIDPKPRMFLPLACAAAAAVGVLAPLDWAARKALPIAAALLLIGTGLVTIATMPNLAGAEAAARAWVRGAGREVTLDGTSRRHFTLVPELGRAPVDDPSRPLRFIFAWYGCSEVQRPGERLIRSHSLHQDGSGLHAFARRIGLDLPAEGSEAVCLFRR